MIHNFYLCKKCVERRFGLSLSQFPGSRYSQFLYHVDNWLAISSDHRGVVVGNVLGAVAATYSRKGWDKVIMPVSIFVSNIPLLVWQLFC